MNEINCTDLKRTYDFLEQERKSSLDSVLEVITKFVVPFRGNFFTDTGSENEVNWRNRDKFDDTAVQAAQIFSSSIQGSLTSPSFKWFNYIFKQDELNDDEVAMGWLQQCEEIVWQSLQDSDFNLEASEYYLDLVSYGTSFISQEWDDKEGFDFTAIPIDDSYFAEDNKGRIAKFFRKRMWTPIQVVEKFGIENVSASMKEKYEDPVKSNIKEKVIFAIYKRDNITGQKDSILTPEMRQYGYKYFTHDNMEVLGEGGYYEMPIFVTRYRKVSGSKYGYSPSMVALSDILTLNEIVEATLEALGKVVDPATITTERGLISDLDLGRGGLTVVKDINDIKTHESKARFDVGEVKIANLQYSINKAFFVDQLQLKDSPQMTATEAQIRYELMQRLLGPTYGRLKEDFLDPVSTRSFWTLYREGRLPAMPENVRALQAELGVSYTGPMARAQKSQVIDSIDMWITRLVGIAEAKPEVMDIPDFDAMTRGIAELSGVPMKYIKTKKVVEAERAARNEQAAIDRGIERAQGVAAAGKDAAAMSAAGGSMDMAGMAQGAGDAQ